MSVWRVKFGSKSVEISGKDAFPCVNTGKAPIDWRKEVSRLSYTTYFAPLNAIRHLISHRFMIGLVDLKALKQDKRGQIPVPQSRLCHVPALWVVKEGGGAKPIRRGRCHQHHRPRRQK